MSEPTNKSAPVLEVQKVVKNYHTADIVLPILKGVNLNLESGEVVALIGRSGSGKSTLLHLIAGVDQANSGEIKILGQSLSSMSAAQRSSLRANKVGMVFQQFLLIPHFTALENVMAALEIKGVEELNAKKLSLTMLEEVGLASRSHHYPSQLSGGEAQRVAIARALVGEPELLLADEPSGSLDEHTGNDILDLFFRLNKKNNSTLLFVTHSLELAKRCDRVVTLEDGLIHG